MFEESNDQSSVIGILGGLIVLVFVGVFISLMIDKRFKSSSSRVSIREEVAKDARVAEELRDELGFARGRWEEASRPLEGQAGEFAEFSAKAAASRTRMPELRSRRDTAEADLKAATDAFLGYQSRYRQQVRSDAAGEKHAELVLPSGRTYNNVTIRRVTSAGIEILHDHGNSRIRPKELDATWRERFQWDREEVEKLLAEERAREESHRKRVAKAREVPAAPAAKPLSKAKKARQETNQKLAGLREAVINARELLDVADSELFRAQTEAANNRGRSVPGSLDTWETRIRRLEGGRDQLREKYSAARARLAAVAPRDSLLRERSR